MDIWICFSRTSYLNVIDRPNITEISRNLALNESNDVTLSCNATGKPPPNVMWSRPGNKGKKYPGSVLPLKNISREQDGEYWCTATNRVGNATASVRVTVNCKYEINEAKAAFAVNCSLKQRKPTTNTEVSERLYGLSFQ